MDKIDTHHHILPPKYVQGKSPTLEMRRTELMLEHSMEECLRHSKGMTLPEWSSELSLESMARNGVGYSILSLSTPAMSFVRDRAEATNLARDINEYAASLRDKYPRKFGFLQHSHLSMIWKPA